MYHDKAGKVIYVGKAKQLKNRVSSYFQSPTRLTGKTALLVPQIATIEVYVVESELEALLLEARFIKKYNPKYNIMLKDGKAYVLIRVTKGETYPAVVTARKMDDKKSVYFGPFPSSTAVREVLRTLRRIFPFQSVLHHDRRPCLYHHLGLCPCVSAFPNTLPAYKKTISHLIKFLGGHTKQVVKDLEKERNVASKQEDFELAAKLQKQIDAIAYVTHPMHQAFEYETNPHLVDDLRTQEMEALQQVLNGHGVPIGLPKRIECYDISNFQSSYPVGSMTVLTNGTIDKSQYRKFKMHSTGPNDFGMHAEMMQRRLKHDEWPLPDLFVIDGGKGQVSAVREVIEQDPRFVGKPLPMIGLAKREETMVTPDLEEIHIPKSSPALQLVMRIRDEAHRFGITFHRKLRSKGFLPQQ